MSSATDHYPLKTEQISDHASDDSGGNFGRLARTNIMDDYKEDLFSEELSGIPLDAWQRFLKLFGRDTAPEALRRELDRLTGEMSRRRTGPQYSDEVRALLRAVAELMSGLS